MKILADRIVNEKYKETCGGCANLIAHFPIKGMLKRYAARCNKDMFSQPFFLVDFSNDIIPATFLTKPKTCMIYGLFESNVDELTFI